MRMNDVPLLNRYCELVGWLIYVRLYVVFGSDWLLHHRLREVIMLLMFYLDKKKRFL